GYTLAQAQAALQALGLRLHSISLTTEEAPFASFAALSQASGGGAVRFQDAVSLLQLMLEHAASLPPPQEAEPPGVQLPSSLTLYRKNNTTVFSSVDNEQINWRSSNPAVLKIDSAGQVEYPFASTGSTTIQATDAQTGAVLAQTQVTVTWDWWQWILVIFALGWLYL
ncbi:MAG: DUF3019 domain-containing protein, partial [Oscillospiraceae bacterium]|nr:DUF3019 domain-containing protein [Oscillospiraceae bacterium]